jgi:putative methionine-R-sulfoxide reductase with GAF domain
VRRPLDVGVVGAVARGGRLSNVADARSDPDFDASIDRDGITGFTSRTMLTCPVKSARGDVVAVVQMVNKHPHLASSEKKWFGRFGRRHDARGPVPFDETDEKLVRMMCEHVAVSMAAMEHTLT